MAKRPRIAVVGSANIDLTTFTNQFPKPGETIFGQKFRSGFRRQGRESGRRGASCAARKSLWSRGWGATSSVLRPSKTSASRELITTHVKQVEGLSSGVAPIFVEPNGQNRILVVKGANDALKPADVDAAAETLKVRRLHRAAVRDPGRDGLLHNRIRAQARNPLHPQSRARATGRPEQR